MLTEMLVEHGLGVKGIGTEGTLERLVIRVKHHVFVEVTGGLVSLPTLAALVGTICAVTLDVDSQVSLGKPKW